MCWSQKSQGMMNICALLLVILMDLAVLHQLLPSHCNLYRFCSREPDTIRRTYDWKWGHGHPKNSSSRSVRIHSSFPFILINLVRIYQGRVILIIPMHNVDHPCAYDFDWYDDGGDDADELDGISREHTTWGILSLVGIWVSLVSIFFFSFLFFFCWHSIPMTWSAKAQKRREWDREWGALSTEGNIWWKGNRHAEWVDVMGVSWLGWICEWSFHLYFFVTLFFFFFFFCFSFGLVFMIFWFHKNFPDRLGIPWLYFYQHDPSFWRNMRNPRTLPFLSCELLGRCCRLNPRGRVFIRLDVWLNTSNFWSLLVLLIPGLPLPKDWISVMYFSLERFTIKSWV